MTYTPDPTVKIGGEVKSKVVDEDLHSLMKDILLELKQISFCMKVLTDTIGLDGSDVDNNC